MINFNFTLKNPFSIRWEDVWSREKPIEWWPNKNYCLQFVKCSEIIGLEFRLAFRQDHAGLDIAISLLGYCAMFNIYDTRHWDYDNNCFYPAGSHMDTHV